MKKKLWGGRFGKAADPLAEQFSRSIRFDYKLARYDVVGSLLHISVLKKAGYLSAAEYDELAKVLRSVYGTVESSARRDVSSEDVHTHIQNLIEKKAPRAALKLHTARSRNDQVALAMKLYCVDKLQGLLADIASAQAAFDKAVLSSKGLVLPGFTHLQHAQPVSAADYFGAYKRMLGRDAARLRAALESLEVVFGAGALAGTPIPCALYHVKAKDAVRLKDRLCASITAAPVKNSLDAVSDRDFVIEIIGALALVATHLSRLAEDLIIWSSKEFDFVELDDAYCTGSSLMPQKKNPDILELIRGYAGRLNGNLVAVLTMMKGLPMAYNRDMQLDKEPLFESIELVSVELKLIAGLAAKLKFKKENLSRHLSDEALYATDIMYYLVSKKIPFKEAHEIVGALVRHSLAAGVPIKAMSERELKQFCPALAKKDIAGLFDPLESVRSKRSVKR